MPTRPRLVACTIRQAYRALRFSTNPHSTAITSMRPGGWNGDAVFVWRGRGTDRADPARTDWDWGAYPFLKVCP